MLHRLAAIILVTASIALARPVHAQAFCQGTGCGAIPFSQDSLNSLFFQFQYQYTNQLFSDIARAGTLANISSAPTGSVNLQKFTLGVGGSAGFVPLQNKTLTMPGVGVFQDVPSGGAYAIPHIFGGVNLGYLMGNAYDPYDSNGSAPSMLSLSRIDVYATGAEYREHYSRDNHNLKVVAGFYNRGFDVRYHLVEGSNIAGGPLFRFLGVSLGTGYHLSRLNIQAEQYQKYRVASLSGVQVFWDGYNYLNIQTKIKTYPVEIMSGMQLLYVLSLSVGGGVTTNSGYADMNLTRIGPVYPSTDVLNNLLSSAGVNLISNTFTSYLTMNISGKGTIPKHVPYAKVSLDINLGPAKIFAEGISTRRAYGANAGVRVQF